MFRHRLLDVTEHEGMVADLAELHDRVHQCFGAAFALLAWEENDDKAHC